MLAWWGNTNFPTGAAPAPALTQQQWGGLYFLLENAALELGPVKPLALIDASTRDLRPDDPLPIAIASFRVAVPRASLAQSILAGASNGGQPGALPARLADAIEERQAFMATAYMHGQWGRDTPVHRGRHVRLRLDEGFYFTNPAAALPDSIAVDLGDGHGFVEAAFGDVLEAVLPDGRQRRDRGALHLRRRGAGGADDAGDLRRPGAPARRRHLAAAGPGARRQAQRGGRGLGLSRPGAQGGRQPRHPRGGVPRGPSLRLPVRAAQRIGMVDALHGAGYDVIIVGLANGLTQIQRNAQVLVECIREARKRTPQPLVVGGVSMGGWSAATPWRGWRSRARTTGRAPT